MVLSLGKYMIFSHKNKPLIPLFIPNETIISPNKHPQNHKYIITNPLHLCLRNTVKSTKNHVISDQKPFHKVKFILKYVNRGGVIKIKLTFALEHVFGRDELTDSLLPLEWC